MLDRDADLIVFESGRRSYLAFSRGYSAPSNAWHIDAPVDVREQQSAPSVLDIFDFAEDWPQQIRLAILVGENTTDDIALLETAAINQGKKVRLFYDKGDALKWLRN